MALWGHRTGATLSAGVIVHEGFPWIKCYRLQTQGSQRTRSCCSMSTMGDEAVHTPFLTDLNKATLDVVPLAGYGEGGGGVDGGGGEWGGRRGDARHLDKNDLQWTPRRMRVIKGRGRDRDRGSLDTWTHRQSLLHRKTNFLWSPTWNPPCFTTQMWLSKKGIWGETFDKT